MAPAPKDRADHGHRLSRLLCWTWCNCSLSLRFSSLAAVSVRRETLRGGRHYNSAAKRHHRQRTSCARAVAQNHACFRLHGLGEASHIRSAGGPPRSGGKAGRDRCGLAARGHIPRRRSDARAARRSYAVLRSIATSPRQRLPRRSTLESRSGDRQHALRRALLIRDWLVPEVLRDSGGAASTTPDDAAHGLFAVNDLSREPRSARAWHLPCSRPCQ